MADVDDRDGVMDDDVDDVDDDVDDVDDDLINKHHTS